MKDLNSSPFSIKRGMIEAKPMRMVGLRVCYKHEAGSMKPCKFGERKKCRSTNAWATCDQSLRARQMSPPPYFNAALLRIERKLTHSSAKH